MKFAPALLAAMAVSFACIHPAVCAHAARATETRYLLFQIFTYSNPLFPPQLDIKSTVRDIITRIGTKGDTRNKLGICLGPLTLSQSDDEVRALIKEGFAVARQYDVAVAFHIDDQHFWSGRKSLANSDNMEWIDWKGTLNTGRRLDWGPKPSKAPPQLCLNCPGVQQAVRERARLIGSEIKKEVDSLKRDGKQYLFAGVIAGSESMIGPDFDTNEPTGYHALSNLGFNSSTPANVLDSARVQIVREFIELWARQLIAQGIAADKIYSHIAFTEQGLEPVPIARTGFATPDVAFDKFYRAGFSTYPAENALQQIHEQVEKHGSPPWISSEGTNIVPNGLAGEPTMETYLGQMFNYGAVMVNIYSWGIGGETERDKNIFRRVTESDEALNAYRKFLAGEMLIEQLRPANQFSPSRFRAKINKIQSDLPDWIAKTHRVDLIQPLMQRLDGLIKSRKFDEADATADEVLKLIGE